MSKKTSEVAVVLNSKSSIMAGIEAAKGKLKEFKHIEDSKWQTSGKVIMLNGEEEDIKNIKCKTKLAELLGGFIIRNEAQNQANIALGIKDHPVIKMDGYTLKEWTSDFILKKDIIENQDNIDKYKAIEKKLEGLLDKEDLKAAAMAELAALLGKE